MNQVDSNFLYFKERHINIPLFLLADQKEIATLIEILLILDSGKTNNISSTQYHNINSDLFLSDSDIHNLSDSENLHYCIREYDKIAHTSEEFFNNKRMWKIPHINLNSKKTEIEKAIDTVDETGKIIATDSFNLVPVNYLSSFCDSFESLRSKKYFTESKCRNVFFGTQQSCEEVMFNSENFSTLINKILKDDRENQSRNHQEEFSEYYRGGWEKDYFDVLTDGQLGDFDEFQGDMDDLDTWSRG